MATGGRENISEMDASVVAGSEAVFDHVCQPCSDDENIREAVGFCVDCTDWLCDECFRIHKRAKPAKHHVLRDIKEMEKSTSLLKPTGKCTEKCDQHSGKRLKYYCPVHDFLGCSLCAIQDHKTCMLDHIPDVCESTDTKNEFKTVTAKLDAVAKESVDIRNVVNDKADLVKTNTKETVGAVQGYIKKLKVSLDEAGAALEETCEKHGRAEITKLKNVARVCDDIEKESLGMKTSLENLQNTGQHCNVFVALKQSKGNLATIERKQKGAKLSSSATLFTFKPNMALDTIITGSDRIGSLIEQNGGKNRDYSNMQARLVTDIPVKFSRNSTCGITGSTLLSPDKLVLVDHENQQVKVVDTKTNKVMSHYKVDGCPWGVCKASDNSVVVEVYNKRKLLFLSVSDTRRIFLLKTMSVNGQCKGVAVMDEKIIVTYISPNKMEIIDTRGNVLQTITDTQIVHSPEYVAVSPDRKSVYVSINWNTNTVTCVNLDGKLIASYKDRELRGPQEIVIDSNGMIYVCGGTSNNVHLLTSDCKKVKVILDESDGLKSVHSVSYCEQTDKLYIGMGGCGVIKVFQLS